MRWQRTLAQSMLFEGIGLHSGRRTALHVTPSAPNTGICFRVRSHHKILDEIRAHVTHVDASMAQLCTPLQGNRHRQEDRIRIMTIEHLMAAFSAARITNACVDVVPMDEGDQKTFELPILDGSSIEFMNAIEKAGITEQTTAPLSYIHVRKPVQVLMEDKAAWLLPIPDGLTKTTTKSHQIPTLHMNIQVNFEHKGLGSHMLSFTLGGCPETNFRHFKQDIASARTFTFEEEVEWMRARGLARGGSLDNALVFRTHDSQSNAVQDRVLNPDGLHFSDEWVRHKMLDCIGDLALAGAPIHGYFMATSPGHASTHALLRALFQDPSNFERCYIP